MNTCESVTQYQKSTMMVGQEWSQLWVDVMCAVGDYDESAIEINGDAKEV